MLIVTMNAHMTIKQKQKTNIIIDMDSCVQICSSYLYFQICCFFVIDYCLPIHRIVSFCYFKTSAFVNMNVGLWICVLFVAAYSIENALVPDLIWACEKGIRSSYCFLWQRTSKRIAFVGENICSTTIAGDGGDGVVDIFCSVIWFGLSAAWATAQINSSYFKWKKQTRDRTSLACVGPKWSITILFVRQKNANIFWSFLCYEAKIYDNTYAQRAMNMLVRDPNAT